jgi:hypothetical protein
VRKCLNVCAQVFLMSIMISVEAGFFVLIMANVCEFSIGPDEVIESSVTSEHEVSSSGTTGSAPCIQCLLKKNLFSS